MYEWLPPDVELMTDVSGADWVVARLRPWPTHGRVSVASFMPDAFEAYARVLHPLRYRGGEIDPLRWEEMARRRGVTMERTIGFAEVTGIDPGDQPSLDDLEPLEGSLPDITLRDLVGFLARWTAVEELVWFGLWEGNGTWWKGAHAVLTSGPIEDVARKPIEDVARNLRIDDERDRVLRATATFGTPQRRYFLVRGYLRSASGLYAAAGENSANLWWPQGRSWLVSTEVDGFSTYVGGSHELVDALVSSDTIEALAASLEDPIDPGRYPSAPG